MQIDPKARPLLETSLPGVKPWRKGKVRDVYDLGDRLLVVATDRQTRKYRNIMAHPRVALLVDNRANEPGDFTFACAARMGRASMEALTSMPGTTLTGSLPVAPGWAAQAGGFS